MYKEDEKFTDRRDCASCDMLLGQHIVKVWLYSPESIGLNIQWECEGCHCRMFEFLEFAECAAVEKLCTCEFCAAKVPTIIFYMSRAVCSRCLEILKAMYQEGGE